VEVDDRETAVTETDLAIRRHPGVGTVRSTMGHGVPHVLKDSALADIVNSIKAVGSGENFISPGLSTFLVKRSRRSDLLTAATPTVKDLTPTERRILKLIGEYKTSKEIAEQLFISIRTVEHHRGNIATKLELHGSHALIKFALENKSDLD